jgi:hypothetical protein
MFSYTSFIRAFIITTGEGEVVSVLNRGPRHEDARGSGDTAPRPGRFTPRERAPGTHWIRGWVGPRAVLDAVVKRKFPAPTGNRTLEPRTYSPYLTAIPTELSRFICTVL